ncbi:hypothetical protein FCM35_KLT17088 [Carex littledalei]|uniref:Uncharacterized protein n=1 Tax=Carex littledalei TaxID=544730 RepID=A0A833RFK1_9POAL|nr:hypothetical protein FCM35_KLT17088 [Carex littledalei]
MAASRLGVVVCGWAAAVLVQGGFVFMLQTKDRVFVTVMFLLVCFRHWHNFCPQATDGSLTEADRSLSANNSQQFVLPISFISRLFYWCKLVSAMTCVVLSMMRLASHDFGQTEVANKATRDFALKVFYVVALVEALVLVFALTFVTIITMQRTVTEALFEWVWRGSSLPSLSDLSPNDLSPNRFQGVAPRRLHLLVKLERGCGLGVVASDHIDFWQSDHISDIACSDYHVSDIAAIPESDHISDLAWLEFEDDISLRHPHSDFEVELI